MNGQFISLLAFIPMLVHGIWGCCWHHDHSFAEQEHIASEMAHGEHSQCSSHHDHSNHDDAPFNDGPCDEEPCLSGGTLLTVAPPHVQLEILWNASFTEVALNDLLKPQLASRNALHQGFSPNSDGEYRALTQVWLL